MAYRSTNPFTNTVEKSFDELSDQQLQAKLQAAQACFDSTWRDQSFAQRKAVLKRAAALMRERQQALAKLATLEMGKLIGQSAGEVALSAAIIDYYADHAEAFLAPEPLKTDKGQAVVESSPMGVLFGVEPWTLRTTKSPASRKVMQFAADIELILVDGLETFFAAHPRSH